MLQSGALPSELKRLFDLMKDHSILAYMWVRSCGEGESEVERYCGFGGFARDLGETVGIEYCDVDLGGVW